MAISISGTSGSTTLTLTGSMNLCTWTSPPGAVVFIDILPPNGAPYGAGGRWVSADTARNTGAAEPFYYHSFQTQYPQHEGRLIWNSIAGETTTIELRGNAGTYTLTWGLATAASLEWETTHRTLTSPLTGTAAPDTQIARGTAISRYSEAREDPGFPAGGGDPYYTSAVALAALASVQPRSFENHWWTTINAFGAIRPDHNAVIGEPDGPECVSGDPGLASSGAGDGTTGHISFATDDQGVGMIVLLDAAERMEYAGATCDPFADFAPIQADSKQMGVALRIPDPAIWTTPLRTGWEGQNQPFVYSNDTGYPSYTGMRFLLTCSLGKNGFGGFGAASPTVAHGNTGTLKVFNAPGYLAPTAVDPGAGKFDITGYASTGALAAMSEFATMGTFSGLQTGSTTTVYETALTYDMLSQVSTGGLTEEGDDGHGSAADMPVAELLVAFNRQETGTGMTYSSFNLGTLFMHAMVSPGLRIDGLTLPTWQRSLYTEEGIDYGEATEVPNSAPFIGWLPGAQ